VLTDNNVCVIMNIQTNQGGRVMTIKELYLLAKEKGILDYEIQIQHGDDGGIYDGTRDVMGIDVIIDDEDEIVVL